MITSKFIAHFLEEVSGWQQKLSIADQVITVWFEVQRTWTHLESIFMSSEDIRKQLPEDSARFDRIDAEFKVSTRKRPKLINQGIFLFVMKFFFVDFVKRNVEDSKCS